MRHTLFCVSVMISNCVKLIASDQFSSQRQLRRKLCTFLVTKSITSTSGWWRTATFSIIRRSIRLLGIIYLSDGLRCLFTTHCYTLRLCSLQLPRYGGITGFVRFHDVRIVADCSFASGVGMMNIDCVQQTCIRVNSSHATECYY